MQSLRNFVNGQFTDSSSGVVSDVVDPSTGEAYAQAPVSDSRDVSTALQAAAPGRVAFLHKPFTPEMLAAAIRRMLAAQEESL